MRYSFASFGMIMVGLIAFVIVMTFQRVTINNESDYYSLKEAMEASLIESIDIPYYRSYENGGNIKIVEEKFVENFTRRFVKNTLGNSNGYIIEFYDIMESPPKASIIIKNKTDSMTFDTEDGNFDVVNMLSGILVSKETSPSTCKTEYSDAYYYSYVDRNNTGGCHTTNRNSWNLNNNGQLLRAYSNSYSDKYTYTYEFIEASDPYYYNVCYNSKTGKFNDVVNSKYSGNSQKLYALYKNFTNSDNDICGYPFYKDYTHSYLYGDLNRGCPNKVLNQSFSVGDVSIKNVNADFLLSDSNYLDLYATDIVLDKSNQDNFKIIKASNLDTDYVSIASNGRINKNSEEADDLYFISWYATCEKQNVGGGFCGTYYYTDEKGEQQNGMQDNVMMVFRITWKVTKCLK